MSIKKDVLEEDIQKAEKEIRMEEGTKKTEGVTGTTPKPIISANFDGLVDVVLNEKGEIAYLVKDGATLTILASREIGGSLYLPPKREQLPFELPRAREVIRWYQSDNDQQLFNDVITYLKRFSCLSDKQWLIVASIIFLFYLQDHPDVHYLPVLLFYASPERGKSRTGKAVIYLTFRGIHIVDLREANLFRFSQNLKATLFFDMKDLWRKAEKNGAEDLLLSRFEKGAQVARVIYPEKGAFRDTVYYNVYGPTVIATNEPVHNILDTRCILITMPNKPADYENPTPEKAQELKERLTAWKARVMDRPFSEIEPVHGLNGRLWDITKLLLPICKMNYPSGLKDLTNALLEVAGQKIEDRKASIEGQIASILEELSPSDIPEWVIKTSDVLDKLNEPRPEKWRLTSQYLGRKLKAMGLYTKIVAGYSEIHLNREDFDALVNQFKVIVLRTSPETLLNSTKFYRSSQDNVSGLVESQ